MGLSILSVRASLYGVSGGGAGLGGILSTGGGSLVALVMVGVFADSLVGGVKLKKLGVSALPVGGSLGGVDLEAPFFGLDVVDRGLPFCLPVVLRVFLGERFFPLTGPIIYD